MYVKNGNTSYIEIDKSALRSNLDFIDNLLGDGEEYYSVVKGNAYGHGITVMGPLLQELGQNNFAVFGKHEAEELLNVLSAPAEIMIMGWIDDKDIGWAIKNDISFYVFDMGRVQISCRIAADLGKKARIHIELETGMHRTGFEEGEFPQLINYIKQNKDQLVIEGICTHYAGAESIVNHYRIKNQIKRFNQYVQTFAEANIRYKRLHTACSAAVLNFPETRMDMARIGILQYGFWPNKETFVQNFDPSTGLKDPLRRVISWKSSVMTLKYLDPGEFAGYGDSFMAERPTKLAVVPVGYAHGYTRSLSNTGRVLIKGQRMGVVGKVNMNMMLVDVTNIPNVQRGDEVVLIGKQGNVTISVSSFGDMSKLLNYELLTRLPQEIPRYIV